MIRFGKSQMKPAAVQDPSKQRPDTVRKMAAMTERLGLSTVPAAWPTGVSQLAQAVDACQRCEADEVCGDWLARVPQTIKLPPDFCPNVEAFARAKQAKARR